MINERPAFDDMNTNALLLLDMVKNLWAYHKIVKLPTVKDADIHSAILSITLYLSVYLK